MLLCILIILKSFLLEMNFFLVLFANWALKVLIFPTSSGASDTHSMVCTFMLPTNYAYCLLTIIVIIVV